MHAEGVETQLPRVSRWDLAYLLKPPWDTGRPPKELVELVEKGLVKPCRSIDLGCGKGHTVRYLLSKGFDAWGIDISFLAVRQATKISKSKGLPANFINTDALSYIPEERYSLATDTGFYHSLPENERRKLGRRVYKRYLRRGGRLLLWCMSEEEPDWGGPHRISRDELLLYFSDEWETLEIRRTHFGDLKGPKALFVHLRLEG